jgi:hypothetical protein
VVPLARRIGGSQPSAERLGAGLRAQLQARRPEIEQTVLARVYSVSNPDDMADPDYALGLRSAVSAAVGYGIAALEDGAGRPAPVPAELLSQARRAARGGVPLDGVLRRYVAGHALLGEFIVQEAEGSSEALSACLGEALRAEAASLDHLIAAVAAEYRDEIEAKARSLHQRRTERARKLLAGELSDAGELDYDLDAWHLGAIAVGAEAERAVRNLAGALDRRPLLIRHSEGILWAWLGGARTLDPDDLESLAGWGWPEAVRVAIGEPAQGLPGWRFTHRQAAVALPIAQRGANPHVRYADVALLASAMHDEVLSASLRDLYLAPLAADRDGGATLRQTLRAYFTAQRNVSSAAAALGVSRKTITARLHTAERLISRPLHVCAAELEAALGLQELGDLATTTPALPRAH